MPAKPSKPVAVFRYLVGELWIVLVIAAFLTALFVEFTHWVGWKAIFVIFGLNALVAACIGFSFSAMYAWVTGPFFKRTRSRMAAFLLHGLTIVLAVSVGAEVSLRIIDALWGDAMDGWPGLGVMRANVIRFGILISIVVVSVVCAFERLSKRNRENEEQAKAAQQEALKARLDALKARTNPHFLFNSLNTVAGLIEDDPARAEAVIEKLSGLLRFTLDGSRKERITLADELHAVLAYLEVESIRFGARLKTRLDADPTLDSIQLPPLLLLPLVENAVLHGVAAKRDGGEVRVTARRNHTSLHLSVEDDGPGPGKSSHKGNQMALADLARRLELAYPGRAALETGAGASGGFRVELRLPLETS